MKLHGGDITVDSGDEGTTFTIELPVKKKERMTGRSGAIAGRKEIEA